MLFKGNYVGGAYVDVYITCFSRLIVFSVTISTIHENFRSNCASSWCGQRRAKIRPDKFGVPIAASSSPQSFGRRLNQAPFLRTDKSHDPARDFSPDPARQPRSRQSYPLLPETAVLVNAISIGDDVGGRKLYDPARDFSPDPARQPRSRQSYPLLPETAVLVNAISIGDDVGGRKLYDREIQLYVEVSPSLLSLPPARPPV